MKADDEEIRKILAGIPDKFDILEDGIDFQTQMDYIEQSHAFDPGDLTEEETLKLSSLLFNKLIPIEDKRKALSMLANLGTVTAFRQIEKYSKSPDKELLQWTHLSLQECRMLLESSLDEENTGFIMSGLGGEDKRLRFYFLVLPLIDHSFTAIHKDIIRDEFAIICREFNSIIEKIYYSDKYVGFTMLMPLDVALGTIIDTGIKKCNELGAFVFEYYYATNQNIPNETEIIDIIRIVTED